MQAEVALQQAVQTLISSFRVQMSDRRGGQGGHACYQEAG